MTVYWSVTLNGRTYTNEDFDGTGYVGAFPDALKDFVAHAAAIHKTVSSTSLTVGAGGKSLTVEAGKPYGVGTPLRIARAADPSGTYMDAVVTGYNGTTGAMTATVVGFAGAGTYSDWSINLGSARSGTPRPSCRWPKAAPGRRRPRARARTSTCTARAKGTAAMYGRPAGR